MPKKLPDIEYLRSILDYNPDTGLLFWKERPEWMFSKKTDRTKKHSAKIWNSANAGKEALRAINRQGYKVGNIDGSMFRAHRVAWALHYGRDPENHIDHINGNRIDNRISNLRDVTNQENSRNQKLRSTNRSGYNGVSWCKNMNMWVARAVVDGIDHKIGYYQTTEQAKLARLEFDRAIGFHINHGAKR